MPRWTGTVWRDPGTVWRDPGTVERDHGTVYDSPGTDSAHLGDMPRRAGTVARDSSIA